jgi:hypothetical protein
MVALLQLSEYFRMNIQSSLPVYLGSLCGRFQNVP